jgi:hypothetical protein
MTDLAHVEKVFGEIGVSHAQILDSVCDEVVGTKYSFMDPVDYLKQYVASAAEGVRVYWTEILYRSHWAAATNLLRHRRWFNACLELRYSSPNYLAFAATLRALLEASVDACAALKDVPLNLASYLAEIRGALGGTFLLGPSRDLEHPLIHFQFAHKTKKEQGLPQFYKANTADAYLRAADPRGEKGLKELYCELCQIVHPASQSLMWLSTIREGDVEVCVGDDGSEIDKVCAKHRVAIEALQVLSVSLSIILLKVLNFFPMEGLWTDIVSQVDMSKIRLWQRIEEAVDEAKRKQPGA